MPERHLALVNILGLFFYLSLNILGYQSSCVKLVSRPSPCWMLARGKEKNKNLSITACLTCSGRRS